MKTIYSLSLLLLSLTFGLAQVQTPQPSPAAKIIQTVGLTEFTIKYSRPAMRGRAIMGNLVPYGEIWRTGANRNTIIDFADPITIKSTTIPAGSYALYVRPSAQMWEVFFYTDTDNWGLPQSWDTQKVAASFEFPVTALEDDVTSFTIALTNLANNGGHLEITWERSQIAIPFTVPTAEKATTSIKQTLAGHPKASDFYSAASYYFLEGKDLEKAKGWIAKAIALENDKYWMYRQQSLILHALGEVDAAIEAAKKSMTLAEKANNPDYVRFNKAAIAEWSAGSE